MDYADVGFFAAKFMLERYRNRLMERYSLDEVPSGQMEFIEALGRKRGCLRKAGIVDIDRASKIFVTELRSGKLGPLTLETPEMMELEKVATVKRLAEKAEQQSQKQKKRKAAFKERNKPTRKRKRR